MAKRSKGMSRARSHVGYSKRVADEKKRRTRKNRQHAKKLDTVNERLQPWNID